jgi:rfaE bifunctional protein kinase chain/domain
MCHGVFDVVHPGHLRHLLFAKSKAEILVVSITSDIHIKKGSFRPHVPEDLRALNLAALEFVDFVILDTNETPLENINIIRPDFFAKGYEYSPHQKFFPRTSEETLAVNSYGGEIIFTPGDFVLSSSAYIKNDPPDIKLEKLLMIMDRSNLSFDNLRETLELFPKYEVHVVGDTIVDSYSHCSLVGGQTKTPTMSVLFDSKSDFVGGAGIVAAHLRSTGAKVKFTTVLGDDLLGSFVQDQMANWKIQLDVISDNTRPTVNKNAIIVGNYRLLKIDTVDNRPISDEQLQRFYQSISRDYSDAVVFSDFRHGIFNKRTIPSLIKAIPSDSYRVADSQVASRWGNILDFLNFDLITPNEREVRFALGDQDSGIRTIASEIFKRSKSSMLILKLGDKGLIACSKSEEISPEEESYLVLDSFTSKVLDPVGAGDALLAYATLAMLATNNPATSTILGSFAAACECERDGNNPVTPEDLLRKIDFIEKGVRFEH